jgi:putative endonuclease
MARTNHHVTLGKSGESYACLELERRGYAILARRFRTRAGEIDVVARDGDTVVFIEVKARRSDRCGYPAEAVTAQKQRQLMRMASYYIFDVVSVTFGTGEPRPRVEVFKSAFDAAG